MIFGFLWIVHISLTGFVMSSSGIFKEGITIICQFNEELKLSFKMRMSLFAIFVFICRRLGPGLMR